MSGVGRGLLLCRWRVVLRVSGLVNRWITLFIWSSPNLRANGNSISGRGQPMKARERSSLGLVADDNEKEQTHGRDI